MPPYERFLSTTRRFSEPSALICFRRNCCVCSGVKARICKGLKAFKVRAGGLLHHRFALTPIARVGIHSVALVHGSSWVAATKHGAYMPLLVAFVTTACNLHVC